MSNLHPLFNEILKSHGMPDQEGAIKIGDKVRCGVYVGGEWRPMESGIVVDQSLDRATSSVDVMSLHGGRPWVRQEQTSHLRKIDPTKDAA